ncbi:MAG: UDP-N-acetylmuramoyl-L-alanyl-D-glutamate--2,6-diaminopimelate ligase [Bacteroidota bacterium]
MIFLRLEALVAPFARKAVQGNLQTEITGITSDSRAVKPGDLFVCVRGSKYDGHAFVADALASGAAAVIAEEIPPGIGGCPLIVVPSVSSILGCLGARFHGEPASRLRLIGVVGTNGKTTSTYLIRSVLQAAGHRVGLIGTIQNLIGDRAVPAYNTTPGPLELQALLAEMVAAGCDYAVMEVSSHAIAQERTRGCQFAAGLFTNITQDHLDYHKTFAEYLRVKRSFFTVLPATARAVINGDDPEAAGFLAATEAGTLTYGLGPANQVRAEDVEVTRHGVSFEAVTPAGRARLRLHLTGNFNVYNSLGALGIGLAFGLDLPTAVRGLEAVTGVPGRFQIVPGGEGYSVVVDYAHTEDGLDNLLRTARQLTPGRLIVVFGCGGDRDRGKRPLMGRVAAAYADLIFVTSDNPRSEDPAAIIAEIEAGLRAAGKRPGEYRLIADRSLAIRAAVAAAASDDLVVIAGKGHETYQIFADRTIHFDDREVAAAAMEDRRHGLLAVGD